MEEIEEYGDEIQPEVNLVQTNPIIDRKFNNLSQSVLLVWREYLRYTAGDVKEKCNLNTILSLLIVILIKLL